MRKETTWSPCSLMLAGVLAGIALVGCSQPEEKQSESKPAMSTHSPMAVPLNPNRATAEELAALPEVDEALADRIVTNRPVLDMVRLDGMLAETLDEETRKALYVNLFIPINLNTASREEIMLVPKMGPKMAHEFEEYRPYKAMAQFRREIGKYVDETEVARFEKYVFIPIDLNTASDEEILAIPGVGAKMLHEFKEYRPYKSMEQFRREIGKYVDKGELARLERYVTLTD